MYPHQHFKRTYPSPITDTDTTTQQNGKRSKPNPEQEHPHSRRGYSPKALCTRKIIAAAMRQDRDGRADVKGKGKMKIMARIKARGIGGGLRKVNGGRVVGAGSTGSEGAAGAGAAGVDDVGDCAADTAGTGGGSMDLSDSQTVDREEIMDYDDEPAVPDNVDEGEEELSSTHPEAATPSSSFAGPSKPPRNYIPIFTAQDFDSCTSDDEPFTPIRIFKSPAPPPSRPAQIYKSDFYRKPKANANLTKAKQTRLTILARNRQLKRSGRIRGYDGLKKGDDVHDDDDVKISQDTEKGKKKKLLVPVMKKFVPTWYPKEEEKKE